LMSMRGWRLEEPNFVTPQAELPRVIPKLIEVVFGPTPDLRKMASELHLTPDFISSVLAMCEPHKVEKSSKTRIPTPQPLQFRRI
ncbi:MAG: hypothetical protein WBE10_17800, partial [Candidatus Acidiferrum sp.]